MHQNKFSKFLLSIYFENFRNETFLLRLYFRQTRTACNKGGDRIPLSLPGRYCTVHVTTSTFLCLLCGTSRRQTAVEKYLLKYFCNC